VKAAIGLVLCGVVAAATACGASSSARRTRRRRGRRCADPWTSSMTCTIPTRMRSATGWPASMA